MTVNPGFIPIITTARAVMETTLEQEGDRFFAALLSDQTEPTHMPFFKERATELALWQKRNVLALESVIHQEKGDG